MRRYQKLVLITLSLAIPSTVYAECLEYRITDYGDHVEAVCVGLPPTQAEVRKREQDILRFDRETSEQLRAQKAAQQRNEDAIKLTRTDCTKSSECGPGRLCVGFVAFGVGACKESGEASRIVEQAHRNADQSRVNQIKSNQDYDNYKINRKLDDIERKIKSRY